MSIDDLKSTANLLRAKIKDIDDEVRALKDNIGATCLRLGQEELVSVDPGESLAQVTLAHRHLEDARMRLGKTIQYLSGGVSKYDAPNEGNDTPPA